MGAILSAVLPFALKFLGWILDKSKADAEATKQFHELVHVMTTKGLVSVTLNESYELGRQKNRAEIEKMNATQPTGPT